MRGRNWVNSLVALGLVTSPVTGCERLRDQRVSSQLS
jgi:hypothetical protein